MSSVITGQASDGPLYRQVMDVVGESISSGALRPGDRLPSLRKMSQAVGVSVPTVQQAYVELERQRRIEARPRSGFFVRRVDEVPLVRPVPRGSTAPARYRARTLLPRVFEGIDQHDLVPLGIANPTMALPPTKGLQRCMRRVMPRVGAQSLNYSATLGEVVLRRQLAYHFLDTTGAQIDPDEILITNGAQEALLLALRAVAEPGDVIAVESPTYHGILELVENLGMLAVEIETCPEEGIDTTALATALEQRPIKACVFASTLNNPLGVTMPEEDRRRMLSMLAQSDTVLIEDDVYGELRFDGTRPIPSAFLPGRSDAARVLTCGSVSKTAAPGYRIGWVISEEFHEPLARLKRSFSVGSGMLPQFAIADFLASGDYGRHLTRLRCVLQKNCERMLALIDQHFPEGTRSSNPDGGGVLWVELPGGVDSELIFEHALEQGISIAPGLIFAPCRRFGHFIRLGYGHPWDEATERALRWLGDEAKRQAGG